MRLGRVFHRSWSTTLYRLTTLYLHVAFLRASIISLLTYCSRRAVFGPSIVEVVIVVVAPGNVRESVEFVVGICHTDAQLLRGPH